MNERRRFYYTIHTVVRGFCINLSNVLQIILNLFRNYKRFNLMDCTIFGLKSSEILEKIQNSRGWYWWNLTHFSSI